jgi:hypothetical protein
VRELVAASAVRAHVHERALSVGGAVGVAEILRMGALGRCVRLPARLFVCLFVCFQPTLGWRSHPSRERVHRHDGCFAFRAAVADECALCDALAATVSLVSARHDKRCGDTNTQTHKQADTQTHKQASKHTNTQASKQAHKQASKHTNTQASKQADTQTHKQASKHTNTQASKHTDTQASKLASTQTHKLAS